MWPFCFALFSSKCVVIFVTKWFFLNFQGCTFRVFCLLPQSVFACLPGRAEWATILHIFRRYTTVVIIFCSVKAN